MVREGLRVLVEGQLNMHVVGEAANGKEALKMAGELKPDVVVMDLSMPEVNGLQATQMLKSKCPDTKVVVLTAHEDESYLRELFKAGASGYVLKRSAGDTLIQAITMSLKGQVYVEPSLAEKTLSRLVTGASFSRDASHVSLSDREQEVLKLVAWGYSNKEAADELKLSVKTVETYKVRIAEKLGLRSRAQIVQYALRQGWLNDAQAPALLGRHHRPRP
jgi:DNA-binding NarL/FixJ family response regulator